MPTSPKLRILVVDDEPGIRKTLSICLRSFGHDVVTHATAGEALVEAGLEPFDLLFLDMRLGTENGIDYIQPFLNQTRWLKIVVITAHAAVESAVEAMKRGASDYLAKPFTPAQVNLVAQRVREMRDLQQRVDDMGRAMMTFGPPPDFHSTNQEMRHALELAHQASTCNSTVRIRAERGTGKSTLARAIHSWSDRAAQPFGTVSCRATPANVELALFGLKPAENDEHRSSRVGKAADCSSGTILLEDICALHPSLHSKLLRLAQSGEYERPGDLHSRMSRARLIVEMADDTGNTGNPFAESLAVIDIHIPPLRHRHEDMLRQADLYRDFFARQNRREVLGFTKAATEALLHHTWPGNIRELRNLIERAIINCQHDLIEPGDFPSRATNSCGATAIGDPVPLDRVEELHIRSILQAYPTIEAAAKILGMDSVTLWRRRKEYGI